VDEAGDAAVVVMQEDEVPSRSYLTTAGFGDDAPRRHCLERYRGDSTRALTVKRTYSLTESPDRTADLAHVRT
jgi:hypothetical protein